MRRALYPRIRVVVDSPVVSKQAAIDERIHELVEGHRPELERLVDQALERELAHLVEEGLAARNGNGAHEPARNAAIVEAGAATKTCAGPCARTLPVSSFEKGRAKCRECRRAENREREQRRTVEQQAPAEPDRPGITADELARRAARYGSAQADDVQRWLVGARLATVKAGLLRPTAAAVELGAGIN